MAAGEESTTQKKLTLAEAAVRADRSTKTVENWIKAGHVAALKVGGRLYVVEDSLVAFLAGVPARGA